MTKHNGDSRINPHDLIAASIVQGALEATKLPPAAARAMFRALGAAGVQPPSPDDPNAQALSERMRALENQPEPTIDDDDPDTQRAALRIEAHQDALVLALARERLEGAGEVDTRLTGFDYPATETAPAYREYELDGQPLVRFYSPEVAFDEGNMLVNLRYRVAA